jgi:hypothetical protein
MRNRFGMTRLRIPRASAVSPLADLRIRAGEGGVAGRRASSHDNEFLTSMRGQRRECLFATVFENQRDGLSQIREALFTRFALAICTGNFSAVGDVPWAMLSAIALNSSRMPHSTFALSAAAMRLRNPLDHQTANRYLV